MIRDLPTREPTLDAVSGTGRAVLGAIRATPCAPVEVGLHLARIVQGYAPGS